MSMMYPRKLVIGGLYLSASCSLRGTLAFHSIPSSSSSATSRRITAALHNGNTPTTAGIYTSPNHHASPPAPTNAVGVTPYQQRSQARRRQYQRFGSSTTHLSMSSTTMIGQDSGEMFDVYLAPVPSVEGHTGPPKSAGFSKARQFVHKDGDWHRSVHIWLHNAKGELIMQKRSSLKDTFPGMWDVSVGGHFTSGDDSLQTAIKETEEELGIECDEGSLRFVTTVATASRGSTPKHGEFVCNEYKDIYLLRYDGAVEDLKFDPGEVEDVKLVHMNDLREIYSSQDPGYIPRPAHYTDPLFSALKAALGR